MPAAHPARWRSILPRAGCMWPMVLNNAVAVIGLATGQRRVSEGSSARTGCRQTGGWLGFIPTEAYPSGIVCDKNILYVTNLEAIGSRSKQNTCLQLTLAASVCQLDPPYRMRSQLESYTTRVRRLNLSFRGTHVATKCPGPGWRRNLCPNRMRRAFRFPACVYIIKENRNL